MSFAAYFALRGRDTHVDFVRLLFMVGVVSLAGFSFAFRAKNGEWRDSHLGFQVSFASP